jgi:hypothetical protein
VEKTEVIPMGTEEYCAQLCTTKKLNEEDLGFLADTKIICDGESARYLGARTGNHTNELEPWLPLIE